LSIFLDLFLKAFKNLLFDGFLSRSTEAAIEVLAPLYALLLDPMFLLNSSKLVIIELFGFPFKFEPLSFDLLFLEWLLSPFSFDLSPLSFDLSPLSFEMSLSLDFVPDDNRYFIIFEFLFRDLCETYYILVRFSDLFAYGVCPNELLSNYCNNSIFDWEFIYFFLYIFDVSLFYEWSLVA